jgi:hypothetical protein
MDHRVKPGGDDEKAFAAVGGRRESLPYVKTFTAICGCFPGIPASTEEWRGME